jgi:hypothetical protein
VVQTTNSNGHQKLTADQRTTARAGETAAFSLDLHAAVDRVAVELRAKRSISPETAERIHKLRERAEQLFGNVG